MGYYEDEFSKFVFLEDIEKLNNILMQDTKIKEVNSMFQQVDDRRKVSFYKKIFIKVNMFLNM